MIQHNVMEKRPGKVVIPIVTQLSAVNIGNGIYTLIMKVNPGIPESHPSPVYNSTNREIDWNLEFLGENREANGSINVDFSGYSSQQISKIFIRDENALRVSKGGVVIKQTEFPPVIAFPNAVETGDLRLDLFSLTKNGTDFNLHLSFAQVGINKYKVAQGVAGPLIDLVNLSNYWALDLRVEEDNLATGNLNIDYVIPAASISTPISLIVTQNPLTAGEKYHKWGRFYLD